MLSKNNYIAFDLEYDLLNQFYLIGQEISNKIDIFIPFNLDQLHMTVYFLGDLFVKIKTNKKEIIDKINFDINNFEGINNLIFDSYELFGSKNNLLVAKFKISKSDEKKIIQFKQYFNITYGSKKHDDIIENYFTPHITLGKILYSNKSEQFDMSKLNIPKPIINDVINPKLKLV